MPNVQAKVEVASNVKKTVQGTKDVSPAEVGSTSKKSSDAVCRQLFFMSLTILYLFQLKFFAKFY